jgi:anti-sigma factor RsiW
MSLQLDVLDDLPGEGHPDEGEIQALLDGELPAESATELAQHLKGCARCQETREGLGAAARLTSVALAGLDTAHPAAGDPRAEARASLDRARWEVRRRRAAGKGTGVSRRSAAAAILLVAAAGGVAAALPGSPLRSLFVGDATPEAAAPAAASPGGRAGVAVGFRDGGVEVVLEGAAPGQMVELEVVTGDRVEVLAPEGTRFEAGTGLVTVRLASTDSGSPAPDDFVRVRIPAGPGQVLVRAGLRHLVRWNAGAFEFGEGVAADPRSDGVRLSVPE